METVEFFPASESEISQILKSAQREGKSVYPVSAGNNWGYGDKQPVDQNAWILNLSKMNRILDFNPEMGILRIEPGVTQKDLQTFLEKNHHEFYVPNTGAGSRGTLLGNALERGFGIAPIQDHASAILSLRGILADGSVYESPLKEIDPLLGDCFTWGVGPHLDHLISQSSWIIITEASLQLQPKAECTDILVLSFSDDELSSVVGRLRSLMWQHEGAVGSIKILNKRQINKVNHKDGWTDFFLSSDQQSHQDWFLTLVVYSNAITRRPIIKSIKKQLRAIFRRSILVFDASRIRILEKFLSLLPFPSVRTFLLKVRDLGEMLRLAQGYTSEVGYKALDGSFDPNSNSYFDINKYPHQLAWLSPLCPLDPNSITNLLSEIRKIEEESPFQMKTLTWTVLNPRTLALVIPVIYSADKKDEFWTWYKAVHIRLKDKGFIPYRFHVNMMSFVTTELLPNHFKFVRQFEKSFDPQGTLLNGRYS
jgi:4-cresol dehydrogenase (hydroxylating) flavoprotein subunit